MLDCVGVLVCCSVRMCWSLLECVSGFIAQPDLQFYEFLKPFSKTKFCSQGFQLKVERPYFIDC